MREIVSVRLGGRNNEEVFVYSGGELVSIRSVADTDAILRDIRPALNDANKECARNIIAQTLGISSDEVSDAEIDAYLSD